MEPASVPRCLTPLMYGRAEVMRMRDMGAGYRLARPDFPTAVASFPAAGA